MTSRIIPKTTVDMRGVHPPLRHPMVYRTWAELEPGEAFTLKNDHEPSPLLYQLMFENPGEFEWYAYEEGPESWSVQIVRREKPGERHITEFMETDHDRLDAEFLAALDAVKAGDWGSAEEPLTIARHGLLRHIKGEENHLFPAFTEALGGMEPGPVRVMKAEHQDILSLLERLRLAFEAQDAAAFAQAFEGLFVLLTPHNDKEEGILYPMIDQRLPQEQVTGLVHQMQRYDTHF